MLRGSARQRPVLDRDTLWHTVPRQNTLYHNVTVHILNNFIYIYTISYTHDAQRICSAAPCPGPWHIVTHYSQTNYIMSQCDCTHPKQLYIYIHYIIYTWCSEDLLGSALSWTHCDTLFQTEYILYNVTLHILNNFIYIYAISYTHDAQRIYSTAPRLHLSLRATSPLQQHTLLLQQEQQ